MRKIEMLLSRGFKGRTMQKDPDRAIRQTAIEIVRGAPNIQIPVVLCLELLSCGEAWLRRYVTKGTQRGYVPVSVLRDFMAEVKAHAFGGDPDEYRNHHDLDLVADLVHEAFAASSADRVDPDLVFAAYAPRIFLHSGDRFLNRDQVLLTLGHPLRCFDRRHSLLTPLDLTMGRNRHRPFRRFSLLEALARRHELESYRIPSRFQMPTAISLPDARLG